MIDTIEMYWKGEEVGPAEAAAFQRGVSGPVETRTWECPGEGVQARTWTGILPQLGRVQLNSSGRLRFGRSLVKVYGELVEGLDPERADNNRVLSAVQANDIYQDVSLILEEAFPFLDPASHKVTRADVCYQRRVEDSSAVIASLYQAVKPTRLGAAFWDNPRAERTGYMGQGKAAAFRCYDKGKESGNRDYINVVRSEEQVRNTSVKMGEVLDIRQRLFNREGCRDLMNERFLDVGFGDQLDVSELIRDGKHTVALLVLHPELEAVYRETVKERGYYAMKKKVREIRARAIPVDLRLPAEAWEEEAA